MRGHCDFHFIRGISIGIYTQPLLFLRQPIIGIKQKEKNQCHKNPDDATKKRKKTHGQKPALASVSGISLDFDN